MFHNHKKFKQANAQSHLQALSEKAEKLFMIFEHYFKLLLEFDDQEQYDPKYLSAKIYASTELFEQQYEEFANSYRHCSVKLSIFTTGIPKFYIDIRIIVNRT